MGSPYLNSGEAIILTTNRVSTDSVLYDVMLTTERIFFIDNRNPRFEPRIIPLNTILSVQGGKTPAQDPAITILFRTGESEGSRQPLNLIFSQDPNENRKPERDDWVRSLIQLSIRQHEKEAEPETPLMTEETDEAGLRPRVRHGVAPEMVLPLSNVGSRHTTPAPVTVIFEEVEGSGEIPACAEARLPLKKESPEPALSPEAPEDNFVPAPRTPPPRPASPPRVIIPQIIEELLPAKKAPASPGGQELAPETGIDSEALFPAIPTAVRSEKVTEEQEPAQLPIGDEITTSDSVPVVETFPERPGTDSPPAAKEPREVAELLKRPENDAVIPDIPEPPEMAASTAEPSEVPQEDLSMVPEPPLTNAIPGDVNEESVCQTNQEAGFKREPAPADASPYWQPPPPGRDGVRPFGHTIAYAAALILIIALIAAGAMLLLQRGPGQTDTRLIPTLPLVPVTTLPPDTELPATRSPGTITPSATLIVSPVPSLPASPAPPSGVWVRVNSTAYYFGEIGNPELMQKVSGSGDHFYKVFRSDRLVKVAVQKQDNSGALLAVAIYRNGSLISTRSVTSPGGSVDLLIDPLTDLAPGLTVNDTFPEHAATPSGLENY